MRRTCLLALTFSAVLFASAKFGEAPPEIHFDRILPASASESINFKALTGKVVVLEMWATWCGPCIAAIPRLNELADQFKDQPVVFLSVTDEEPAVVEAFLKDHPISGWVGIAHTKSPLAEYGVWGVPTTFLIDATGKIAGSTDPDRVTAQTIQELLLGMALPAVELTVARASAEPPMSAGRLGRNLQAINNGDIKTIVSRLWDTRYSRISGNAAEDRARYDLSIALPRADPDSFPSQAREVVATALRIKVTREMRETDVWVLAKNEVMPASLKPPGTITEMNNSGWQPAIPASLERWWIKVIATDLSVISTMLESAVGKPVIDETGITGRYDFKVLNEKASGEGWIDAMRKAGFKVEQARRPVEFLVVTKIE